MLTKFTDQRAKSSMVGYIITITIYYIIQLFLLRKVPISNKKLAFSKKCKNKWLIY